MTVSPSATPEFPQMPVGDTARRSLLIVFSRFAAPGRSWNIPIS